MNKLSTLLMAALLVAASASAQVLYRISGNSLEKPSYIIGTFHLANASCVQQIGGVKQALTDTEQVYGELKWDDMANLDSLQMMQKKMMLPEGQTLKTVLTKEQFAKLDAFVTKAMGVSLSSPMVFAQMGQLAPGALATQLQMLLYMSNHMGEFDPTNTLDQYFQAQAKNNNEPIGGLETMAFQADLIFTTASLERQVTQLMCLLDNTERHAALLDRMAEAYYNQDINALEQAMNEKFGTDCDATEEEKTALFDNRNKDWAARMPAIMAARPTLFVVGAGHLIGDKGVLALLRNAGYTVEAVK